MEFEGESNTFNRIRNSTILQLYYEEITYCCSVHIPQFGE